MKILTLIAASVLALGISSQAQENPATIVPAKSGPKIVELTPDDAQKRIAGGMTVIDLRTEEEFKQGHIQGAKNINALDPAFEKNVAALDTSKPILVYCRSGRRSKAAIENVLSKTKFPAVHHLTEGILGWKKAGKPLAPSLGR